MNKKACGARFKALLDTAEVTTTEFAAVFGKAAPYVHNWYSRGVPAYRMEEVARLLSVNSEWLKTGEGPKASRHLQRLDESGNVLNARDINGVYKVNEPTDVELPFYQETPTVAGASTTKVVVDSSHSLRLPRSYLDSLEIKYTDAICAHMIGNSMAERIEDGSILAIDRGFTQIVDGAIYAIEHDGMVRIKYLHRVPGNALRLRSHNRAEYPDEIFRAEQIDAQRIHVLGWVFWWSTLTKLRPQVPFL
jgi:phage repressor protein C with HTH and peptisase S24 domain